MEHEGLAAIHRTTTEYGPLVCQALLMHLLVYQAEYVPIANHQQRGSILCRLSGVEG